MSNFAKFQSNAIAAVFALALSVVFVGASVVPAETVSADSLLI
ncbi:MAG: hypothetical protein R3E02_01950 [Blastomonas sp.]